MVSLSAEAYCGRRLGLFNSPFTLHKYKHNLI